MMQMAPTAPGALPAKLIWGIEITSTKDSEGFIQEELVSMIAPGELQLLQPSEGKLTVAISGSWKLTKGLPSADEVERKLADTPQIEVIDFNTQSLKDWDTGLLTLLVRLRQYCSGRNITFDESGLPQGARRLVALAVAVPEKKDARQADGRVPFLEYVGNETVGFFRSLGDMLAFIGETVIAIRNMLRGKALFRRSDLWLTMEACSGQALPIVSLVNLIAGLIIAFIGAMQLSRFGADILVADMVGLAMIRSMASIMTGMVMAGRTAGAFAAQIGTMQVNQEIDALKTLGISPMEFLVLPRILALLMMTPLLCLYANLMGILGGMAVGVGMLDISFIRYFLQTAEALNLWDLGIGIFSGTVFGAIVALAGCMRGLQCGRKASAVGDAATSAVVTSIVGIVIATAVITGLCHLLGI
jgi:phospholipid/cholesterol/gamma-HCH transport system permease protein